jgi:hypothetical protein
MFTPVSSQNSDETNWNNINNGFRDVNARETIEIYKDDTGTPVVVLDKNGLKTTTPGGGVNVLEATDEQYTFDSNRQTLRIVQQGSISCIAPTVQRAGSTGGAVNNSQSIGTTSFTPSSSGSYIILAFIDGGAGNQKLMPHTDYTNNSGTNITMFTYRALVVAGSIIIYADGATYGSGLNLQTGSTYTVNYFVLQQDIG